MGTTHTKKVEHKMFSVTGVFYCFNDIIFSSCLLLRNVSRLRVNALLVSLKIIQNNFSRTEHEIASKSNTHLR